MNRNTIHYTLTVSANGFLSGFDAVVISEVNLIVRIYLSMIDKIGRRHLTLIGYLISLLMMGYGFFGQASSGFNLFITIAFIVIHAAGKSTVIRLLNSEILPNKQRVKAQTFGNEIHWGVTVVITLFGTCMISHLEPWRIFSIFLSLMILQLLFMLTLMQGTKSRPLECVLKNLTTT